jgi:hypothetical protein
MIIIIGLVILVAAMVAGVAGVLTNGGSGHSLTHHFAVFGYHVTGSTGTLFLSGILTGALGMLGLSLLLAGARRTSRRGRAARRETATVTRHRDDLLGQRETADGGQPGKRHLFGPWPERVPAAAPSIPAVHGHVPDVPADASVTPD